MGVLAYHIDISWTLTANNQLVVWTCLSMPDSSSPLCFYVLCSALWIWSGPLIFRKLYPPLSYFDSTLDFLAFVFHHTFPCCHGFWCPATTSQVGGKALVLSTPKTLLPGLRCFMHVYDEHETNLCVKTFKLIFHIGVSLSTLLFIVFKVKFANHDLCCSSRFTCNGRSRTSTRALYLRIKEQRNALWQDYDSASTFSS